MHDLLLYFYISVKSIRFRITWCNSVLMLSGPVPLAAVLPDPARPVAVLLSPVLPPAVLSDPALPGPLLLQPGPALPVPEYLCRHCLQLCCLCLQYSENLSAERVLVA